MNKEASSNIHISGNETPEVDDDHFFIDETPENGTTARTSYPIVIISPYEIAYDIWYFKRSKSDSSYTFSGVYKTGEYDYMHRIGYYKRYRPDGTYILIKEDRNIINQVEISQLRDVVTNYVRSFKEKLCFDFKGVTIEVEPAKLHESFLNTSHLIFNESALGHLQNHEKPILRDTKDAMFFYFTNCVVKVTKDGITQVAYSDLDDNCVWREHIITRAFVLRDDYDKAHIADFIFNISNGQDDRIRTIRSTNGYLLHNHNSPSKGQAVIAYDEEITDFRKPQGGTGKGIFAKALNELRKVVTIDGKRFDENDRFCFQTVKDTSQVVFLDDVKPVFDFLRFNSVLAEGYHVEAKNKPSFTIDAVTGPKTYITSNSIIKGEGTTVERRQFIIEFSPFYSKLARQKLEPIVHTHGCMFFDKEDWDNDEWNRFYTYMLYCGCFYLNEGLQYYELRSVAGNKVRQNTSDDFAEWVDGQSIQPNIDFNLSEWYLEFKNQFYGDDGKFTQRTFNNWMKTYASANKYLLKTRRSNSINYGTFTPEE